MKNLRHYWGLPLIITLLIPPEMFAQTPKPLVLGDNPDRKIKDERRPIPYDHIRESDVFWAKRIWRVIDLREKMNLPFVYPKQPFVNILIDAAYSKEIQFYEPVDDEFTTPMSVADLKDILEHVDTITLIDVIDGTPYREVVREPFNYENVKKIRIKEDWIFDDEKSTMIVRIIGISPIMEKYDENGNYQGELPLFWAYYPDLRYILANYEAFNPQNDRHRYSWENIFEMRMFSSYIYKESNVHDRRIQDYATGIDALLESERIRREIWEKEHNLWSY